MKYHQNFRSLLSRVVLIVAYGLFLTTSAQAGEIKIGSLQFSDTEWSVAQSKKQVVMLTNNSNGVVLVNPPTKYAGDKEAAFRSFLKAIDSQGQEKWKIKAGITSHGYDVLYTSGFVKTNGVNNYYVPVAFFSGNEVTLVMLFDLDYRGKDELQESFGKLLSSARFTNNPSPQNGPGKGQLLEGFYVGIGAKTGVSVLAQVTVEVGAKGLWMKSDGRYALTEAGITGDFDAYCQKYSKNCGRYQIANGQFTTWRAGSTQDTRLQLYKVKTKSFAQQGNDLILGKTRYRHIPPMSNFRLNGDYRLLRADSVTGIGNQVSSGYVETAYGFTQDGRFVKGGSISMFSRLGNSSVLTGGDRNVRAGRYQIDGYTLTLFFDNGKTEKKAFFVIDGVPVINGYLYEKLN